MIKLVATVLWLILCSVHSKGEISIVNVETASTSLTISWAFPQEKEDNLTMFRILTRYTGPCTDSIPQPRDISISTTVRSTIIDSLEEYSTYNVTVDGISTGSTVLYTATTTAVTRATRPPSPQNFRSTQITPTSVSLEWDDIPCLERNSQILEYRIFVYIGNDILSSSYVRTGSSQNPSYTRTELIPDTLYSFYAYAAYYSDNNVLTQGRHSVTIREHTPSILVTIHFTQVEPQQSSISLTWSSNVEPESVNLLRYEILARYVGPCRVNSFPAITADITNPAITTYNLQNLEEYSTYEVNVVAVAENGANESTNATTTTLGNGAVQSTAAISIMSIVAGTNTITLTWNSTVEPSCLEIVQYEIQVQYRGPCEEGSFEGKSFVFSNSSTRHHQVMGLEELSLYEVEITMTLDDGRTRSTSSMIATQGEVGDSPSITSVFPNPTSVSIGWKMPPEVCVERYEITAVYAGPCSGILFPELHNVTVTSSEESPSTVVSGLRPFSYYNISITAINSLSRWYTTFALRTGSSLPGEPTSLEVSSISETAAELSWEHSCLDHHANITAYVISYGPADAFPEKAEVVNVSATTTNYQLDGLEPGSRYTIQVYAVSENIGSGMKSDLLTVTTRLETETDHTEVPNTSNLFSNSSVVVAVIVVSALVILGLLVVAVVCIGVVGAVLWKRNSKEVAIVATDSNMELEDCSAYGHKDITLRVNQGYEPHSNYQHYESIHSVENPNYDRIKPMPGGNPTYSSLVRQASEDSDNSEYNTLDRVGGTLSTSATGENERNFHVITNSVPN